MVLNTSVEFPKQDFCLFLEQLKWGKQKGQGKGSEVRRRAWEQHGHLKEVSLIIQNNRIPKFKDFINGYYCRIAVLFSSVSSHKCLHVCLTWNWVNKPPTIHYTILLFCKKAIQFWERAGEAWKLDTLGREMDFTGEQKDHNYLKYHVSLIKLFPYLLH